jgi:hypothetical protein
MVVSQNLLPLPFSFLSARHFKRLDYCMKYFILKNITYLYFDGRTAEKSSRVEAEARTSNFRHILNLIAWLKIICACIKIER